MSTTAFDMQPVNRDELRLGTRLAREVYDRQGRLLCEAGCEVTEDLLMLMPRVVYTRCLSIWEDTPAEVVEALFSRTGRKTPSANERRHERHPWRAKLTVTIEQRAEQNLTRCNAEVVTHDLSRSGFSFLYRQFLQTGTRITAHFNMLPNRPTLAGTVRNCVLLEGMQHRVGVAFDSIER